MAAATPATLARAENSTPVTVVTASDQDAGTVFTYSLSGGADAAKFQINSSTGALSFVTAPNFEVPADTDHNNSYIVQVRVSDGSLSDDQIITVNVTDVNDVAPSITTATTQSVPENSTFVAALTSTDVDTVGTNPAAFSIIGGSDAAKFTISNGNLVFVTAPDFENPSDADHNNSYVVQVAASDGVNVTNATITVNVTDVNDVAPSITTATTQSVVENGHVRGGADLDRCRYGRNQPGRLFDHRRQRCGEVHGQQRQSRFRHRPGFRESVRCRSQQQLHRAGGCFRRRQRHERDHHRQRHRRERRRAGDHHGDDSDRCPSTARSWRH